MKGMTDNPDLSKLQSIELEYSACRGDSDSSRTTMKNKPTNDERRTLQLQEHLDDEK